VTGSVGPYVIVGTVGRRTLPRPEPQSIDAGRAGTRAGDVPRAAAVAAALTGWSPMVGMNLGTRR